VLRVPSDVPTPKRWEFEGFTLDQAGRTLTDAFGKEVLLWRSEFALLLAFLRAPGHALDAEADPGAIEIGRRRDEHRQIIVIRPPPVDLGRVVHRNIDHRPIDRLDSDNGPSLEIRSCGVDLSWPAATAR
jgi:hypothetical protein